MSKKVEFQNNDLNIEFQKTTTDLYSKELILQGAINFFTHPPRSVDRKNLKIAKNILKEIEQFELKYSDKDFSILKNDSVLVAYLAYKFGEIVGLNKEELSDVYIAGLVQNIGKVYMCGENKELAYQYTISPLKSGDKGFEEIAEAFKLVPSKTQEYLEKNTKLRSNIIDTASNYLSVYSNLFKDGYPNAKKDISQLDTVLWFADSLSALSFSSIDKLERNYKKGSYVSLMEAFELLREQTEDRIPQFWGKASSATLMSLVFTMIMGMSSPSKSDAANYTAQQVIALTNDDRANQGLTSLNVDQQLMNAAMNKARDMFEKQYWSHYGPNGETPWQFIYAQGYSYIYAGENLAKGFTDVQSINQSWLSSPEHRANILKPEYDEIGVAVMDGILEGKEVTLVVQMFTKEKTVAPPPPPPPAPVIVEKPAVVKAPSREPAVVSVQPTQEKVVVEETIEEVEEIPIPVKEEVDSLKNIKPKFSKVIPFSEKTKSEIEEQKNENMGDEVGMLTSFNDFLERAKVTIKEKKD